MLRKLRCLFAVVIAVFLVACGSGSGSSNSSNQYTVGGNVSGLGDGKTVGLHLYVNGGSYEYKNVSANGAFTFGPQLASGDTYEVVVDTQPSGQKCTVSNGAGTLSGASVTNVVVSCSALSEYVYSTNEMAATVATYAINSSTGALTAVGVPVSTGAARDFPAPKGVAVDPNGKLVYVTNENAGTIVSYSIDGATGALSSTSSTSTGSNSGPLGVVVDPASKFVYVAEAGTGGKKVASYSIVSATGSLVYAQAYVLFPGPSPSEIFNLAINPSGNYLYATSPSGIVISLALDRTSGAFTLADMWQEPSYADVNGVAAHPNGQFVYVVSGNYGSTAGGVYVLAAGNTGSLTQRGSLVATQGRAQALAIEPAGKFAYVINDASGVGTVIAYSIDSTTGALTAIGSPLATASPTGITVDRTGKFVYVANSGANTISMYSINATTGALTPVAPPTIGTGANTQPQAITSH